MNSLSRSHCQDDTHTSRKFHKKNEVELKCGCPGSATIPLVVSAAGVGTIPPPVTLSTVTLNIEDLCDPCIKFEFASNISTTAGVILTVNFQIFKLCRNQFTATPIGPVWTFSRLITILESNTFSFIVCDCNICPEDCCTYSVVATVASLAGAAVVGGIAASLTISNATLSALVVENDRHHCC